MEEVIMNLNEEEIDQMVLLSNLFTENENPSKYPESFCRKARECSKKIPQRILDHFSRIDKNGFIIFRGIPIEYLGETETPKQNTERVGEKTQLAKIQGILLHVLGEMIAYEAEGAGYLFQDVVPVKEMSGLQTSIGSNIELEIHTEQAFSELRPDFLSLACIRGDAEASTYILPISQIIENSSDPNMLYEPLWKTGVDLSFKLQGQEFIKGDIRGPLAILNGTEENPHLLFDEDLMTGITGEAHRKIGEIVEIYYKHRIAHCLQPGEILIIDNRKVVHGRSPFSPKYDGKDRFLIRAFGFTVKKYGESKYARKERMILAKYS